MSKRSEGASEAKEQTCELGERGVGGGHDQFTPCSLSLTPSYPIPHTCQYQTSA